MPTQAPGNYTDTRAFAPVVSSGRPGPGSRTILPHWSPLPKGRTPPPRSVHRPGHGWLKATRWTLCRDLTSRGGVLQEGETGQPRPLSAGYQRKCDQCLADCGQLRSGPSRYRSRSKGVQWPPATLSQRCTPPWGSRGREFKSPQPDNKSAGQSRCEEAPALLLFRSGHLRGPSSAPTPLNVGALPARHGGSPGGAGRGPKRAGPRHEPRRALRRSTVGVAPTPFRCRPRLSRCGRGRHAR